MSHRRVAHHRSPPHRRCSSRPPWAHRGRRHRQQGNPHSPRGSSRRSRRPSRRRRRGLHAIITEAVWGWRAAVFWAALAGLVIGAEAADDAGVGRAGPQSSAQLLHDSPSPQSWSPQPDTQGGLSQGQRPRSGAQVLPILASAAGAIATAVVEVADPTILRAVRAVFA